MNKLPLIGLLTTGVFAMSAQAALYDRGNGMIYDDVLNITWLQDANYAQTSGFDTDGKMNHPNANAWADSLIFGGYDDWRVASSNGSLINNFNDNSTEMGSLFYDSLGNVASPATPNYTFTDATLGGGLTSFINVQAGQYWDKETCCTYDIFATNFNMGNGYHRAADGLGETYYVWAVRDGDVSQVPVPAAAWLFGTALLGLVGVTRRHRFFV